MISSPLSEITQFLGLSKRQALVYEYLLANKQINISEISKFAFCNRLQVYEVFDTLVAFNLIQKPPGKNKQITLVSPENIQVQLRQKLLESQKYLKVFQDILPNLQQSFSLANTTIPVRVVEGRERLQDLFLEMYENSSKELLFLGNSDEFYNFFGESYVDFAVKKRVAKGVTHKVLSFQPGVYLKRLKNTDIENSRQVRFLPAEFESLGYLNIYQNKIINWDVKLGRAVVIEDEIISNFYKTIFEILWGFCE